MHPRTRRALQVLGGAEGGLRESTTGGKASSDRRAALARSRHRARGLANGRDGDPQRTTANAYGATMAEQVDFHFDVMCPWAYQSAVWIRDVRDQLGLDIGWRFFSLEEINRVEGKKHPWERPWSYGWSLLRVAALLRRTSMDDVDRFYDVAGRWLHVEGRKPHTPDGATRRAGGGRPRSRPGRRRDPRPHDQRRGARPTTTASWPWAGSAFRPCSSARPWSSDPSWCPHQPGRPHCGYGTWCAAGRNSPGCSSSAGRRRWPTGGRSTTPSSPT